MIRFDDVSVAYSDDGPDVLAHVTTDIVDGELCLVVGSTGSGKSTLLRCINGLVPHFSGGRFGGHVTVAGRDTRTHPPRELADVVGYVGQDPLAGFVTDTVEDELAYGMESLGIAPAVMRRRVEEVLDLLGLAALRRRALLSLSAGEQQRVAIGSVLTVQPKVLVLDEPTSALDPSAAEDVLAALTRLVHDLAMTVVLAEHRLERVAQFADRVIRLDAAGGSVDAGAPADVFALGGPAPPVVELGRIAGWSPLPLSVRDARRAAESLRSRLTGTTRSSGRKADDSDPVLDVGGLVASYDGPAVLRGIDISVARGERVAVMGRNGAGKSTLLAAAAGLHRPTSGTVRVDGVELVSRPGQEHVRYAGLVPQEPLDLLWAQRTDSECADADHDARLAPGTTWALFDRLAPGVDGATHPRDLSEGQRLSLALAVVLSRKPPVVLLDEPTRGLDYGAKDRLAQTLQHLADAGHAVVLATHDVEFAAIAVDRIIVVADGEVVTDGRVDDVALSSPVFAPQVAKVFAPLSLLTVDDVAAVLP